ncbi:unnamed protein product [Owenia fusiformis]|uniref:Uncharacterized protein n=1 Tax=Owenia fusiformis TaxID=6347 RepID=A0A8J1UD54_OWEFU|nr:unnamed protein product [Owenia fusiformis]
MTDYTTDDVFISPPPDGGYGWVVVFASFMIQLLSIGTTYSFGVLYVDFLDFFKTRRSDTAWIGSLQPCLLYLTGIFGGPIIKRVGCRPVAVIGALISAFGMTLSASANHIAVLYLTYGILTGIGNGLMYIAAIVSVQYYFERRRSFATGISVGGSGAGMLVFGVVTRWLLQHYHWRITLLIEGALMLLGIVFGALLLPLPTQTVRIDKHKLTIDENENDSTKENKKKERSWFCNGCSNCAEVIHIILKDAIDLSPFRNPCFVLFCFAFMLFCFGYHAPFAYTPDRAIELGESSFRASLLVSIIGMSNLVSRLGIGWFTDYNEKVRFYVGGITLLLSGVASLLNPFATSYIPMVIYAVWFGTLSGSFASLFPVILVDLFGMDLVEKSVGLTLATSSIAFLTSSPLCGWIIDATGSIDAPFYVAGATQTLGAVLYFMLPFCRNTQQRSEYEAISSSNDVKDARRGRLTSPSFA